MEMSGVPDAEYLAKLEAWFVLVVCALVSVCSQVAVRHYVRGFRQSAELRGSGDDFDPKAVNDFCCAPWQVQAAVIHFAEHAGLVGCALCCRVCA